MDEDEQNAVFEQAVYNARQELIPIDMARAADAQRRERERLSKDFVEYRTVATEPTPFGDFKRLEDDDQYVSPPVSQPMDGTYADVYYVDMYDLQGGDEADVFRTDASTWQYNIYETSDNSPTEEHVYPGGNKTILSLKLTFTTADGGILLLSGEGHDQPDNGTYVQTPKASDPSGTYTGGARGRNVYVSVETSPVTRPPD